MIHAVAEGLALSLDEGASTAERLARESQRMDLSANLALAGTTSDRVCLCEICGCCHFLAAFSARRVGALRFRRSALLDAVRGPSHTSVRPNISSHGTSIQRPARKASCSECKATSSSGSAGAQPRTAATYSASAAGGIHTQVGEASIPIFP